MDSDSRFEPEIAAFTCIDCGYMTADTAAAHRKSAEAGCRDSEMRRRNKTQRYWLHVLAILGLSVLACSTLLGAPPAPTTPPEPPPRTPTAPPATLPPPPTNTAVPDVSYQGVEFSYADSLAANVTAETVPAVPPTAGAPHWEIAPEYVQFTFEGYGLFDVAVTPRIMVFPAPEYADANPTAAEQIAALRRLLADKPPTPDWIPFLPLFNAGQMMRANVLYLSFQNGAGVRFLTQYGQDVYPINNHSLFYTFQGLTSDGRRYVAATLPVSNPILPESSEIPGGDYQAFADNFATYVRDVEQQLEAQPASSFTPDLSWLDAVVQSLMIE